MKQINNIYETYTEIYQISICCTSTSIITEQKVWKVEAKVFFSLPSVLTLTLGKSVLCRVPWTWHSAKEYICRVPELRHSANTTSVTALDHMAGTCCLCRVPQTRHSAKANFTVCLRSSTRQKANLPSVKMLPSVFWITLGIFHGCRVLDFWHSAKRSALGNNRVSGSEINTIVY